MRFSLVAAAVVVLLLIACNGPAKSTSEVGPENTPVEMPEATQPARTGAPLTPKSTEDTPVETPEVTEPAPTGAPPTRESPENTFIETPEYTGVIFSEEGALAFSYILDQASTSFWEPSIDDISKAEKCISRSLVSVQNDTKLDTYQQENLAFILNNLEKYRRQYVGIVVDGEKRIWCNSFLSDDSFSDWERVPVDVDGGGRHFWQIEYDLLNDECINFNVHGES